MPSRAGGGDSGGRSLFFTHGEGLEPQSGSASKSPKALAAYLRRSASRGGKTRAKVLTAEERHERARQAAEARRARRKPMTYSTEDFVRRAAGGILRGDQYRGKFVCLPCLVTMTRERLHPGWRQSEIERAMDKVSETPGAITYLPTFICALCQKTRPCLGAPSR